MQNYHLFHFISNSIIYNFLAKYIHLHLVCSLHTKITRSCLFSSSHTQLILFKPMKQRLAVTWSITARIHSIVHLVIQAMYSLETIFWINLRNPSFKKNTQNVPLPHNDLKQKTTTEEAKANTKQIQLRNVSQINYSLHGT